MTKTKRIEAVVKELHLEEKDSFTIRELNTISEKAKVSLGDVMYYLRYER